MTKSNFEGHLIIWLPNINLNISKIMSNHHMLDKLQVMTLASQKLLLKKFSTFIYKN